MTPGSLPPQTFLHRPGLLQDLDAFCQAQGYMGLVAMIVPYNESKVLTRQLMVYSQHETFRSAVSWGPGPQSPQHRGLG